MKSAFSSVLMGDNETLALLNAIGQSILDKKGFNVIALDLRGVSTMMDYLVVAEGNVELHTQALGKGVIKRLAQEGLKPLCMEGSGDWIVIDFGTIFVHLFIPELRERYALERIWHAGRVVDLSFGS